MEFGIIFRGFWSRFCSSICRMPTPSGTKRNNGKRQEHADNYRNMQESNATKNAQITTPIENLQAAECNQLQQTPIYKYGGGGARAAWRIRIRRPRLAERGARGVSDTSADFCRLQSLRRTPPYPPTRPISSGDSPKIRLSGPKMQIFANFLPIENPTFGV